jgi:hypothetical protein
VIQFIHQLLLSVATATCAWAFIFALLGHKAGRQGESYSALNICGRLFDLFLMVYPLLLLSYLYLPVSLPEAKLMLVGFLGFILGYVMMKMDIRDFFKMTAIYFAFMALNLFSLSQSIGLVMLTTIGTALVAAYLFFMAVYDESVRSILYPYFRYFRLVVWLGLLLFSPLYIGSTIKNIFLLVVVIAGVIISGPLTTKLGGLVRKRNGQNNGVAPLTGKWGAIWGTVGSVYIISWFMIFYLEIVKPDLNSFWIIILFICLTVATFLGYRLLEGSAIDAE